jgi:drug/metabolite transporter (DMT)-like permease
VAIVLSILSALIYGAADFCGGIATRRTSMYAVVVISQFSGLLLLLAIFPFVPHQATAGDILFGALAGIFGAISISLLYHALSIGTMGVISPVTAVLAALIPLVYGVAIEHNKLGPVQYGGILFAIAAIALISLSTEKTGEREIATAGVREAILAGIGFGAFFILLSYTHKAAGVENLVAARITSLVLMTLLALVLRKNLVPKRAPDFWLIVFSGFLDMSANIVYVFSTFYGYLAIVAVLGSLYPASTVFLARVILGERLSRVQQIGVACALAGVLLISLR